MDHRCWRGDRCAAYEPHDGDRLGRRINAERGLCDTCIRQVDHTLTALPTLYVHLHQLLGRGRTIGGEPVRMSRDLPVPIRLHIDALQADLVAEASAWAGSVADVKRIPWAVDIRPGRLLDRSCALLAASLSTLLALRDCKHVRWEYGLYVTVARDGLDGAVALLDLHRRARQHAGHATLIHRLPAPCPRCETLALERADGDDTITCRSCSRAYTWDEYERLCLALVARRDTVA